MGSGSGARESRDRSFSAARAWVQPARWAGWCAARNVPACRDGKHTLASPHRTQGPIHNIDVVHIAALAAWLSGRVSSCRTGAAAIANPVSDRSFMVPPPSTTRGRARSAYNSRQCRRGGATSSRLAGAATAATANRGCGEICPAVADAFAARAGTLSRLRRSYASRTTRVMDRTRRRRWRRRPDALRASVALPAGGWGGVPPGARGG